MFSSVWTITVISPHLPFRIIIISSSIFDLVYRTLNRRINYPHCSVQLFIFRRLVLGVYWFEKILDLSSFIVKRARRGESQRRISIDIIILLGPVCITMRFRTHNLI